MPDMKWKKKQPSKQGRTWRKTWKKASKRASRRLPRRLRGQLAKLRARKRTRKTPALETAGKTPFRPAPPRPWTELQSVGTRENAPAAAIYSLWFGLDYGSILTAYALYTLAEYLGYQPFLLQKPAYLWTSHYDEPDNIAGKFIYPRCRVLRLFDSTHHQPDERDQQLFEQIRTHIVGSDVLWNPQIIGRKTTPYFLLSHVKRDTDTRVSYSTSCGKLEYLGTEAGLRNETAILLRKFQAVSVKSAEDALSLENQFYLEPELAMDPVFLCPPETFLSCAEQAPAAQEETEKRFIFTYFKNGSARKRDFALRGNGILLQRYLDPLRNFIDINRYPESRDAIGLEPAFHILAEDWLFYLSHSDFVMTDDYYGACFAILFQKNFLLLLDRNLPDLSRYTTLLEQLGLLERLVYVQDDLKRKEYLFRKPIRYGPVNKKLSALREDSFQWLKQALAGGTKG